MEKRVVETSQQKKVRKVGGEVSAEVLYLKGQINVLALISISIGFLVVGLYHKFKLVSVELEALKEREIDTRRLVSERSDEISGSVTSLSLKIDARGDRIFNRLTVLEGRLQKDIERVGQCVEKQTKS